MKNVLVRAWSATVGVLAVAAMLGAMGWAIVALPAGCGSPQQRAALADRTDRVAQSAQDAVDTAREAFLAWDAQHQLDIVDRATSLEDGEQQLAAYRKDRYAVVRTFQVAYSAIAAVASLVPLVEAGRATEAELLVAIIAVADAVETMRSAVAEIMRSP